jgi:hypothetical protein
MKHTFITQLKTVERTLATRHGEFALFCLVELEEVQGVWDVIASANWLPLPEDEMEAIKLVGDCIYQTLESDSLGQLSTIVVLQPREPFVQEVLHLAPFKREFMNLQINGLEITHLHILARTGHLDKEFKQRELLRCLEDSVTSGTITVEDLESFLHSKLPSPVKPHLEV